VTAFAADPQWTQGLDLQVVIEPEPLGTGGALRNALPHLDERFLFLNGDSVFDFNWLDLCALAADHPGSQVAMGLRREVDASRYGVVVADGERVTGFRPRGGIEGGAINGGVCLLDRSVAAACPTSGSFEQDVLPDLAAQGKVTARVEHGFFLDIGVPEALASAQALVPASLKRGAIFFDRDGVLNVDHGYTHRWETFDWVEGAVAAVKAANDRNLFAFVITNQGGVARGLYEEAAIGVLHAQMQAALRAEGAHLDDIRYCPHHPRGAVAPYVRACDWRKPNPGMILDLIERWPVDVAASHVIGDKTSDLAAAAAAGVAGTLFQGGPLDRAVVAMIDEESPSSLRQAPPAA
jgi:D-glycero-D-manno-heptose 1,7-bisphosphate phosphatase